MEDLIPIKIFENRTEAEMAKAFLKGMGISAEIKSDDAGGMMPHLSFSNGVKLLVAQKEVKKALEVLDKKDFSSGFTLS